MPMFLLSVAVIVDGVLALLLAITTVSKTLAIVLAVVTIALALAAAVLSYPTARTYRRGQV